MPGILRACVQTKSMMADVKEKTMRVLIGPTFWAAMSGSIRPMIEQPLHMARLDHEQG